MHGARAALSLRAVGLTCCRLRDVQGGSAAGPAGSAGALPRQLTLKLNVQKAALLLSLLSREDVAEAGPAGQHRLLAEPAPLLELAAAAITGAARSQAPQQHRLCNLMVPAPAVFRLLYARLGPGWPACLFSLPARIPDDRSQPASLNLACPPCAADVHDMGQGSLEGTVKSEVQVAAFSAVKAGWEPLVEPWHCR